MLARDKSLPENVDSDGDIASDNGENNKTGSPLYDTVEHPTYHKRPDIRQRGVSEHTVPAGDPLGSTVVYTRSPAETENYLDTHGIDLCKNPIIQRRTNEQEVEHEQRICVRYLQPPPLPRPGPLTIEEIRRPTPLGPPLLIREQAVTVEAAPPLILRERPPRPPPIPGPETKTVFLPSGTTVGRSVVIERFASSQEKPRDIIIERWLPYAPFPEREVIRKTVESAAEGPKPTCTIINYDNVHTRVHRSFALVDVYNADPEDYVARYRDSLLDSRELLQEVRRAGVTEDITSTSALSLGRHVERKSVDYRQSRNSLCDCFSELTGNGKEIRRGARSSYIEDSNVSGSGVMTSKRYERHSNYRTLNTSYPSRDEQPY